MARSTPLPRGPRLALALGLALALVAARAPRARAECGFTWDETTLVGVADDGSYLTHTRYQQSLSRGDAPSEMNDSLDLHAPDGAVTGTLLRCAPDNATGCTGDPTAPPQAGFHWQVSGAAPGELVATGDPDAAAVTAQLVRLHPYRPVAPSPIRARVAGAFVRAGGAVIEVLSPRDLATPYGAPLHLETFDGRPYRWKARLLERAGAKAGAKDGAVFLELATQDVYSAYGGECGESIRSIAVVPRSRLSSADPTFAIAACLAIDAYDGGGGHDDLPELPGRYQCLVDLGDDRAVAALAAQRDDDAPDAPALAAAELAIARGPDRLVALAAASDPAQQAFALRALAQVMQLARSGSRAQQRLGARIAPVCVAALARTDGDARDAADQCAQATARWAPTLTILEALGQRDDDATRSTLGDAVRGRRDLARVCAGARAAAVRKACDAVAAP